MTTVQPPQPAAVAPAESALVMDARAALVIMPPEKAESGRALSVSVPAHGIELPADELGAGVDEELDFPESPSHAPSPAATMQSMMAQMKSGRLQHGWPFLA